MTSGEPLQRFRAVGFFGAATFQTHGIEGHAVATNNLLRTPEGFKVNSRGQRPRKQADQIPGTLKGFNKIFAARAAQLAPRRAGQPPTAATERPPPQTSWT
jgi:hypothetical protein